MSRTQTSSVAEVRQSFLDVHDAIWQDRRGAVPCRWYEREWAEPVMLVLTMVGMVYLFTQPVSCLWEAVAGILLLLPFGLIAGASAARKNALAQSYWSPFTDTELEAVASLPLSSKTPGWDGWMAAAADHRLGLADLKAVVAAIDAQQADECQRHVLQHQNQIIFQNREAT